MLKKEIFNLEFPSWCQEMTIFGYKFSRIDDYRNRLADLQHFVTVSDEFTIEKNL
jgi:hypothetical protein